MDNLNVFVSQQSNTSQQAPKKFPKFFSGPKIIFAILGVIVLIEVIYAIKSLAFSNSSTSPLPQSVSTGVVQQTSSLGKISLTATKTIFKVNEEVPVSVMVDSGGRQIDGVDLIVHFDPKVLEATQGGLIKGTVLSEYPLLSVDSSQGLVTISGINVSKSVFKGVGRFAVINFIAKSQGKSSLTIDFKKGSTTASNLVEASTSKNILDEVDNLELEIQ